MKKEERDIIIKTLQEKGATNPCSRCNNENHTIIGFSYAQLVKNPGDIVLGGTSVPVFLVGCDKCGYISQHAATGPLDLLKKFKEKSDE